MFGGDLVKKSLGWYNIPCSLNSRNIILQVDLIESDIPCLISKEAMRQAGVKLDLTNNEITIFNERLKLKESSSVHFILPIGDVIVDPT